MRARLRSMPRPAQSLDCQEGCSTASGSKLAARCGVPRPCPCRQTPFATLSTSPSHAPRLLPQVFILPTIRINGAQYRGKLSTPEVLRAICAGFVQGNMPQACSKVRLYSPSLTRVFGEGDDRAACVVCTGMEQRLPASQPAHLPACLPASLPASRRLPCLVPSPPPPCHAHPPPPPPRPTAGS